MTEKVIANTDRQLKIDYELTLPGGWNEANTS